VKKSGESKAERETEFEEFWATYKRHGGKTPSLKCWLKLRQKGVSHEDLKNAAANYIRECENVGRFVKDGSTFLGPKEYWKDYVTAPDPPPYADPEQDYDYQPMFRRSTPAEEYFYGLRDPLLGELRDQGFPGNIDHLPDVDAWRKHMSEEQYNLAVKLINERDVMLHAGAG
jgi:hypothetical protein